MTRALHSIRKSHKSGVPVLRDEECRAAIASRSQSTRSWALTLRVAREASIAEACNLIGSGRLVGVAAETAIPGRMVPGTPCVEGFGGFRPAVPVRVEQFVMAATGIKALNSTHASRFPRIFRPYW
jgi:hypothetical protein